MQRSAKTTMTNHHPSAELIQRSRELRSASTPAEETLWRYLRDRRMDGLKFRRQHPVDRFILDFYCETLRLAIEVDGGGHLEPEQEQYDSARTQTLNDLGIQVLRFWNNDVLERTDLVLEEIHNAITKLSNGKKE